MTAKKIFPFGQGNSANSSFNIILLAEGFLNSEKRIFLDACSTFSDKLLNKTPFNYLRSYPTNFQIYLSFQPSSEFGPAINETAVVGRTLFESSLRTYTRELSFNMEKVNQHFQEIDLGGEDEWIDFSDSDEEHLSGYLYDSLNPFQNQNLYVVLLPELPLNPEGGLGEFYPTNITEFYFVATTLNGFWWQVVFRAIGKMLGLGDEFAEASNDMPSAEQGKMLHHRHFNLVFQPSRTPNENFKWFSLLTPIEQGRDLALISDPGSNEPYTEYLGTATKIELWEGGGGFKKQVYRSAQDCIMRRDIKDFSSTIKQMEIPFCPVCEYYLREKIKGN